MSIVVKTELDELRAEYAKQIFAAAHDPEADDDLRRWRVDHLLMEWGAKAYRQGRQHMAERMKKCADEWVSASS